ncbi:MAG: Epoxyqueuosine reductase [Pelotomaculum sp. PtaB.Bin104]|nr:MAG: Epoxyqueuosine reductase [Pelotomaculum sp. PtaB.Bin104]
MMQHLKNLILNYAKEKGAALVGFAPVSRWSEQGEVPEEFHPTYIWPPARTVIVIGMAMPLPMVETTPSALHMELYNSSNRELDGLAYHLTNYLNGLGHASFYFPRDCYGSIKILLEKPLAAFSHVMAAKYAGLGTLGLSHNLLTPQFGPRVRLVSVFTAAELPSDGMLAKEQCIKCKACITCCPPAALNWDGKAPLADYDKIACAKWHEELTRRRCYPCGICTKVCPVGEDRKNVYQEKGIMKKYLEEEKALARDPNDPRYRSWTHVRNFGSWQK